MLPPGVLIHENQQTNSEHTELFYRYLLMQVYPLTDNSYPLELHRKLNQMRLDAAFLKV